MPTATTAAISTIDAPAHAERRSFAFRLGGVAIASLVPAVFWCGVIGLVSFAIGKPLSASTVELVGAAIAIFLLVICAPLMLRRSSSPSGEEATRARQTRAPNVPPRI
jgi:hypothetical protein